MNVLQTRLCLYKPLPLHTDTIVILMTSDSALHLLVWPATHLVSLKQIRWPVVETGRKKKDFWIFVRRTRSFPRFPSNQTHFVIFLPASFSFIRRCCIIGEATCSVFIIRKGREIEGGRERAVSLSFLVRPQEDTHTHSRTNTPRRTLSQSVAAWGTDTENTATPDFAATEALNNTTGTVKLVIFIQQFLPEWRTVICRWTLWEASCFDSTLRFELGCSEPALCLRTRGGC